MGDGVTDDTAAIQEAINAAGALGGGLVYFPPGTYRLASANNSGINMASGVALPGRWADANNDHVWPHQQPERWV